jgi:hypothetical protein
MKVSMDSRKTAWDGIGWHRMASLQCTSSKAQGSGHCAAQGIMQRTYSRERTRPRARSQHTTDAGRCWRELARAGKGWQGLARAGKGGGGDGGSSGGLSTTLDIPLVSGRISAGSVPRRCATYDDNDARLLDRLSDAAGLPAQPARRAVGATGVSSRQATIIRNSQFAIEAALAQEGPVNLKAQADKPMCTQSPSCERTPSRRRYTCRCSCQRMNERARTTGRTVPSGRLYAGGDRHTHRGLGQ